MTITKLDFLPQKNGQNCFASRKIFTPLSLTDKTQFAHTPRQQSAVTATSIISSPLLGTCRVSQNRTLHRRSRRRCRHKKTDKIHPTHSPAANTSAPRTTLPHLLEQGLSPDWVFPDKIWSFTNKVIAGLHLFWPTSDESEIECVAIW